jgi:glycerophosphoryl diester phosphodiesterase
VGPEWMFRRPIAHRGLFDLQNHPENSLAAFRQAVSYGIPFELDVQLTKDGHVVVVHDADLGRLTGEHVLVSDLNLSTVRQLRLGTTDEHIPMLHEVLEIANNCPFIIDVRRWAGARSAGLEKAIAAEVREYDGPFALQSFDPLAVFMLRRLVRDRPVGQASGSLRSAGRIASILGQAMLTNVLTRPAFISYELSELPNSWVSFWHRLGIPVLAWTVHSAIEETRAVRLADNFFFDGYLPNVYNESPPEVSP